MRHTALIKGYVLCAPIKFCNIDNLFAQIKWFSGSSQEFNQTNPCTANFSIPKTYPRKHSVNHNIIMFHSLSARSTIIQQLVQRYTPFELSLLPSIHSSRTISILKNAVVRSYTREQFHPSTHHNDPFTGVLVVKYYNFFLIQL